MQLNEPRGDGVWVICGSAHHVDRDSHQKRAEGGGGREGVLYTAVKAYLDEANYHYKIGKDNRGGLCGSIFISLR